MYIYDEHYENEKPVPHHAAKMKAMVNQVPAGMIHGQIIADPAGEKRSGMNMRSYFNHYAEYGLWFKPGTNQLEPGIMKVYTYFSLNKLKIMSNCVNTIAEARAYKYRENSVDETKNRGEKPIDAFNHAMDALRYIVMELPDDPDNLVAAVYEGNSNTNWNAKAGFKWPKALQDDFDSMPDDWYTDF